MKNVFAFCCMVFFITACGVVPGLPAPVVEAGPTLTPLPTSTSKEFPTVADHSCLLGTAEPLRVEQPQGDLMGWRPDSEELAFVAPAASSNWFAGTLKLITGPDFQDSPSPLPNIRVFGDLAWSPDGTLLAFVAWRASDGLYTVMTYSPAGGETRDWFPGESARTENGGSSSKAILSWQAGRRLRVLSACGPDCDQTYEINVNEGVVTPFGEATRLVRERFDLRRHEVMFDESTYPYMLQPNWSPDNSKIAYFDEDDRAMVLLVSEKQQYILDTALDTPRETKWAYDNQTLAVRTDDRIYIYNTLCK